MRIKDSPDEKARKCREKIYKTLDEFSCAIIATPIFSVKPDGNLNVVSEVKILPLIKPKPSKYVN